MNVETLRQYLCLDQNTGHLAWRARAGKGDWNAKHAGRRAGGPKGRGYRTVRIDGVALFEHRVVYAIFTGVDPGVMQVDHINGQRDDNRPANLRLATNTQNVRRRHKLNANNTSGEHGVCWHAGAGKWAASIRIAGANKHLGLFTSKAEAREARRLAEFEHFGQFNPVVEDGSP